MIFRPVAATIVLAVATAGGAFAQTNELEVSKSALRDGLWEIARIHAEKDSSEEAKLVILESYASENRWDEVAEKLQQWGVELESPGFGYYRAVVAGEFGKAAEFLRKSGSMAGKSAAKMLEADLWRKMGDLDAAKSLWRSVVSMTNVGERAFAVASANLGDIVCLRKAYETVLSLDIRRMVGLKLGSELVRDPDTSKEGETLIRRIVKDCPDAEGACDAFIALAESSAASSRLQQAADDYRDAIEIWPDAAKRFDLQFGRGEVFSRLGRHDEALKVFSIAEEVAKDDESRALAILKQGDELASLGNGQESMSKYRTVLEKYPKTDTSARLRRIVEVRELESKGRDLYREYRFEEARKVFADVAGADASRRYRMEYFSVLCLYGSGRDSEALAVARKLSSDCEDAAVRADATLWLAKFAYNRREWKESSSLFVSFATQSPGSAFAPEALLWATRAAFADNDFAQAIKLATSLVERYPESKPAFSALLVQSESLMELARYDESVLVLESIAISEKAGKDERLRAQLLKADALFAMGADNPARYHAALEEYRNISFGEDLAPGERIVVAFKIGRVLEKLKRHTEAVDQYYTRVVLAYREGRLRGERYDDDSRAAFLKAAFRLADEFESRGSDKRALGVLRLVVESDVPAGEEAMRRIERISTKGRFL